MAKGTGSEKNVPENLKKIITSIDELDWYFAKEEGLGNLYEGLLEKNANEKKSGAGHMEDGKNYKVKYYNLDAILSVGYRVNSKQAMIGY